MKSDCIVLGAELDGLVAAAHLAEQGHSVQLLSPGAGSLHYAPAGVHVLGYAAGAGDRKVINPYDAMGQLGAGHPYSKLGGKVVADSLEYFASLSHRLDLPLTLHETNRDILTPAGLGVPAMGISPITATCEACAGRSVAIVNFSGYRDFPHQLLAAELAASDSRVAIIEIPLPGSVADNAVIAKAFDALRDPQDYFAALRARLPVGVEIVLFPAILGLARHGSIIRTAQEVLGVRCLEVATLPVSVPGHRLEAALRRYLQDRLVDIVPGFCPGAAAMSAEGVELTDAEGHRFQAEAMILATGGVLMGGLDVQSTGIVREPVFDLLVEQTAPLSAVSIDGALEALHRTGVRTNAALNPFARDGTVLKNVFVTGQTLAGFNPAYEGSAEGVSISTGWSAARSVHALLGETVYA